jgi:hypothetical protein
MNRMYGSKGAIEMDPTGGSTAVPLASMNAWTLNMARNKADVTSFGDPNLVYVQGLPDIKGTLGGWYDSDDLAIFDAALGEVSVLLKLIPSTLLPTMLWTGLGWLDASIDVKATGAISIAGNFVAAAGWTREPVVP